MPYLRAIWKRKWLIIVPAVLLAGMGGMVSLFLPTTWDVEMLVQPGRALVMVKTGKWNEIVSHDPKYIAAAINQGVFNQAVADELKKPLSDLPLMRTNIIPDTKTVSVAVRARDVAFAKSVLNALFNRLQTYFDEKINTEYELIKGEKVTEDIRRIEQEKAIKLFDAEVVGNKIRIVEKRKKELEEEAADLLEKNEVWEKEIGKIMEKQELSQSESILFPRFLIVYSESFNHRNRLRQSLDEKTMQLEDLNLQRKRAAKEIERLNALLEDVRKPKERIEPLRFIKEPTPAAGPNSPKVLLNILLAGLLGLLIFTMLALFLGYLEKHKSASL